jgi:hypothetical protein
MKPWLAPLLCAASLFGQPSKVRLPDEAAGLDGIARTLISAFDQADIVALGEWHGRIRLDSDLRIALVRHSDFAKKVRSIVVEFGSTSEQSTLNRYIRGENVSRAQLEQVWKTTTQAPNGVWDSPIYADFFAAVRDVNSKLPADARVRVFGGDPGPGDNRSRESAAVSVLKEQVLQKHGKALVIYGAAHFYRTMPKDYLSSLGGDIGLARKLEIDFPGRTFVVIPVGRLDPPRRVTRGIDPDFQKLDRALRTQVRPVLVSLQRLPFRDFTAEEFLGRTLTTCRGARGCVSFFREAVSLSAKWLMRAFMLAGAPTLLCKRSRVDRRRCPEQRIRPPLSRRVYLRITLVRNGARRAAL